MTGPSSSRRGERAGTPGATWESELRWGGERVVDDLEPDPVPNRAARRALARQARSYPPVVSLAASTPELAPTSTPGPAGATATHGAAGRATNGEHLNPTPEEVRS